VKPIELELPEPPSANRWWRNFRGRMVLSKEARDYKAMVAAGVAGVRPIKGRVRIQITWERKRKSGDLDKRVGILLDALQGIAYANDKDIVKLEAERLDLPSRRGIVRVLCQEVL
jgi:crossover junction endodeoxyribonuclease RusA